MSDSCLNPAWLESLYAANYLDVESAITDLAVSKISGPKVLLLGNLMRLESVLDLDFPLLARVSALAGADPQEYSLAADSAFLPFAEGSFSSVILPHCLEAHELPHQVLREAHRVLQPEGHLVLTCFNPISLIGLQRLLRHKAVPRGHYYPLSRTKDWLHLLGFEVVASAMCHYAPLSKNTAVTKRFRFLNAVGDRWLPMFGGGYVISARKREHGVRLVGKKKFARTPRSIASAPASSVRSGKQRGDVDL